MPDQPSRSATFRRAFLSGVLLLAPLAVTVWAFLRIIDLVGGVFSPRLATLAGHYLPVSWQSNALIGLIWDILGTTIVVLLIALLGWLSHYVLGRYLLRVGDRFIMEIPGVSAVYNTVKQIVATFGTQGRSAYSKVVLVEFPRAGVWTLGFVTNQSPGEAQAAIGSEVWAVFVPTTPNPTGGYLVLMPRRTVIELEMSVADGMKMIISGGAIVPPWPAEKNPSPPAA